MTELISRPHWDYFLALESDLLTLTRYIEINPKNFSTYSIELTHLLFACSSETEILMKQLSQVFAPTKTPYGFDDFWKILSRHIPDIKETEISFHRYNLTLKPWNQWQIFKRGEKEKEILSWWNAYNSLKHKRHEMYELGNLEHTLQAVAALYSMELFYHHAIVKKLGEGTSFNSKDFLFMNIDLMKALQPKPSLLAGKGEAMARELEDGKLNSLLGRNY